MKRQSIRVWSSLGLWIIGAGIAAAPCLAQAASTQDGTSRFVPVPVTVTSSNRARYTAILPTWRRVTPVGQIVSTPNFPTKVIVSGSHVLVLANGATPYQTVTWYSPDLQRQARLGTFAQQSPPIAMVTTFGGTTGVALDPQHIGAPGMVYTTDQPAKQRASEALKSQKVERISQAIPTKVVSHSDLFQGMAASTGGIVYATGGNSGAVMALQLRDGAVHVVRQYSLRWQTFPSNQYPYTYQGNHEQKPYNFYPDSVVVGPHDHHLYVTGMLANSLARINIRSGRTVYVNVGPYPFAVVLADRGSRLAVSDWAGSGVTILDRKSLKVLGLVATGPVLDAHTASAGVHPTAMAPVDESADIWVANANNDRLVEIDTQTLKVIQTIDDRPYANAPPGSYPDALAIARSKLFVANAGNDDIAVYDISNGKLMGLIPTGWYPSALALHNDSLYVVAAKGLGTGPNLQWQYIGNMMNGLLQKIPLQGLRLKLPGWTQMALRDDRFQSTQRNALAQSNARTTAFIRRHVHYVVFILRENKTFDEDFGDYTRAEKWANPNFDLYGPRELPNLYHLARHDALFTNFMADGEVTAQGHQWTDGASDSDVVQRLWPQYYSQRGLIWNAGPGGTGALYPTTLESHDALEYAHRQLGAFANPWMSYPQRLYLFNNLLAHHISFEDFGENLTRQRDGIIRSALAAHVDQTYPGWDRMVLDTHRVHAAISWLKKHPGVAFPHFIFIWIPGDHTAGLSPCYYSPDYYVANNDHATAQFLHYLSGTPQWRHMVVFLDEDDAQSGADHINAHRTLGLAIGPWVRAGKIDTEPLSQVNIVRSIEAVLGLPAMSQWDANAQVISGIWRHTPRIDRVPVLPMAETVQFNAGKCTNQLLLRREAAAAGHTLKTDWLKQHTDPYGSGAQEQPSAVSYSPTSILKVSGPEQMRQEWIASKGEHSYQAFQRYIHAYAKSHGTTVAAYEANDGNVN